MHSTIPLLNEDETNFVREMIVNRISKLIGVPKFDLKEYHLVADDDSHKIMGQKHSRTFDSDETEIFLKIPSIRKIISRFPNHRLSQVVYDSVKTENRNQVYFRVVRPGYDDVGPPHCDYWFDIATGIFKGLKQTLKLWIAVEVEKDKSGLFFYPFASQFVPFLIQKENGIRRPVIDAADSIIGLPSLVSPEPGEAVLFYDDVLHAGAPNRGIHTRVNVEIALVSIK